MHGEKVAFYNKGENKLRKKRGKRSMRENPVLAVTAMAFIAALTGCHSPKNVGGVKSLGIVQTAPVESDKGYVEFMSVCRDVPIPVYQVDKQGNSYRLASFGLNAGDAYHKDRHGTTVQNLRVSEPAGEHTFLVENNGERIQVPVKEGKITPVEVNYTLLDDADLFRTYRVSYRVFEPVPYQEERLTSVSAKEQSKDSTHTERR